MSTIPERRSLPLFLTDRLLALSFFLLPWIGVGVMALLGGRSPGTGAQPALLTGALVLLSALFLGRPHVDRDGERILAVLSWTVLGAAAVWGLDEMGLQGDWPWLKALKQLIQLVYFFALASVPAMVLSRSPDPAGVLWRWERAASAGMLVASTVGLYLAAAFYLDLPGRDALMRVFSSNPSIAAGSDELFLGQHFVGIVRVRSGAAEPLYFGSYLLCVLPATAVAWVAAGRWGRLWRGVALILGLASMVLTFSRGVYLGAALLLTLVAVAMGRGLLPRPRRRTVLVAAAIGLVGGGGLAAVFSGVALWELPALMLRRMAQSFASHDLSNLTRLASWHAALVMFLQHPLQGAGWGAFGFWFYRIEGASEALFAWPVTNSLLLRILAETGMVGALLWALALWRPLAPLRWPWTAGGGVGAAGETMGMSGPPARVGDGPAVEVSRRAPSLSPAVGFVLAATVAAMLLQLMTFSQINLPHLWLGAGVAAAVARCSTGEG